MLGWYKLIKEEFRQILMADEQNQRGIICGMIDP